MITWWLYPNILLITNVSLMVTLEKSEGPQRQYDSSSGDHVVHIPLVKLPTFWICLQAKKHPKIYMTQNRIFLIPSNMFCC